MAANEIKIIMSVLGAANVSSAMANIGQQGQKLNAVMAQTSNLFAFMGQHQIAMVTAQAGALTQGLGKLASAFSKLGFIRGGVLGIAAAGLGLGGKVLADKIKEAKNEEEAVRRLQSENISLAMSLNKVLNARIAEGAISKERAAQLRAEIALIEELSQKGMGRGGLTALGDFPRTVAEQVNAITPQDPAKGIAGHRELAKARSEADMQVERARIERELAANEIAFKAKERQLAEYLGVKYRLTLEAFQVEQADIARQEFEARANASTSDSEVRAKAVADLARLNGEKQAAAIQFEQELAAITAEGETERQRIRAEKKEHEIKMVQQIQQLKQEELMDEVRLQAALKRLRERQLSGTIEMFSNMATAARAFGREGFLAYKAFAIAATTVETYKSAQAAYASVVGIPYIGPVLAPIAAAAAVAAGIANIAQIASQTYAAGGYTGSGNPGQLGGMVHLEEYVMPAHAVQRVGVPTLDAIKDGALDPAAGGGGAVNVGLFFDEAAMAHWLGNQAGEAAILSVLERNIHRFRR
jgi:hypothetical protein